MTEQDLSFKQAYEILKNNAERLEAQEQPEIDQLMQIVEESLEAYKACKSRVDAIQTALNQTFKDEELSS